MKILSNAEPKARKEHVCNFCGGIIKIGDKYHNQTNVYDGDIYTWKTHFHCNEIASKLKMYDDCDEGVTDCDFNDFVRQEYHDLMIGKFDDASVKTFSQILEHVCKEHKIL